MFLSQALMQEQRKMKSKIKLKKKNPQEKLYQIRYKKPPSILIPKESW